MKEQQRGFLHQHHVTRLPGLRLLVLVSLSMMLAFVISACSSGAPATSAATNTAQATPTATTASGGATTTAAATPSATASYPVKVYFSKAPQSVNDFNAVFPVNRVSPTSGVGTFAIEQLIAGPTPAEQSEGYVSELHNAIQGSSTCPGDADFTLTLDKKGTTPEPGTATLKFCRVLSTAGVGADARIRAEISNTLTQFPTIKKVVILTQGGHCFGDESGMDLCLRR